MMVNVEFLSQFGGGGGGRAGGAPPRTQVRRTRTPGFLRTAEQVFRSNRRAARRAVRRG